MIKFYRRIRYDLMEKNKTGKYFKYAIGEIVLVVIGILIALQINNWNQERISRERAYTYLNQINSDLELDLNFYNYLINSLTDHISIFEDVTNTKAPSDALIAKMGNIITANSDPREFSSSYDSFVNSGYIDLIEDKELLTKFQTYYRISSERFNNMADYQKTFNIENIEGPLVRSLVVQGDGTFSVASLKEAIANGNLLSSVNWQKDVSITMVNILNRAQKEARELQTLIKALEKA